MRRGPHPVVVGGMAIVLSISLSACEAQRLGPAAVRRDGSALVVAVCRPISVTGVLFEERLSGEWETFWKFDADITLATGDQLSTGSTPPISGEIRRDPFLGEGGQITLLLSEESNPDHPDAITADFDFGPGGLSEAGWLHPDGSMSSEPCDP